MKNVVQKALEKGVKEDKTIKLSKGRHNVNAVVRINGQLVVGADTEVKPTVNLMSLDFLLLALHSAGATREAAINAIGKVAGEYLKNWTGTQEDKDKAKAAREEMINKYDPEGKVKALLDEMISGLPKAPRSGSVKFEGHIEEISVSELNNSMLSVVEEKVS